VRSNLNAAGGSGLDDIADWQIQLWRKVSGRSSYAPAIDRPVYVKLA